MPPRLPATAEAIRPEWLSEALGAKAVAVEIADAHSGTTGRAKLHISWAPPVERPASVFVKLPPSDETQRQMVGATDMGRREARFYAGLSAAVPVRVPTALWSGWGDDPAQYLMLLEDLAASGCDFPVETDPHLLGFTQALVEELAQLHARFSDPARLAREFPWVEGTMRNEWGRMLVQTGLDTFRDVSPPEFIAIAELYVARMDAFNDLLDRGPHTLIHGDCHLGNLFRDGARPGFLDWACTAHAPGLRDVAYFLCNSIPTELRRKEERDLLHRYRQVLRAAGAEVPSFDETWWDYRRLALTSWVAAVATAAAGSRMQPIEVGERAMRRTNAAVQDLDSLALLREELGAA
jgi:aminoglycoside phosphotransferase (APT) family kinase protein